MSFLTSIIILGLAGLSFFPRTIGYYLDGETTTTEKGLRYIEYHGPISGTFSPNDTGCTKSTRIPAQDTSLFVGVAGPWDTNPFWFQLAQPDSYGYGISTTNFLTADLLCYEFSGKLCSSFEFNFGVTWYFVGEQMLDLNQTAIQKTVLNGMEGYRVVGNESSYVNNNVFTNQIGLEGTDPCSTTTFHDTLRWANNTPFTYNLTFTNSTVSMDLTLSSRAGFLVLNYTGDRVVDTTQNDTVVLNTTDPTKPVFTYLNGSNFKWYNISGNGYGVTVDSMATLLPLWTSEMWTWCVLATMMFVLFA